MRFTASGKAVANFRIVGNDRKKDESGTWQDADPTFLDVSCWERLAENVAESVRKGNQVVVIGKFRQRQYTTKEGENRTTFEIQAYNVAQSLKYRTVTVNEVARTGAASAAVAPADDQWATPAQDDIPPF
jgi:single-strand DNA-binding protein